MLAFDIIVGTFLLIALSLAVWWAAYNRRQKEINNLIARELRELYSKAPDHAPVVLNTPQKHLVSDPAGGPPLEMLQNPELLATIVTVLISKYGDTRLNLDDFAIGDDKFVSVYVDTASDEIILSLDRGLADLQDGDESYEDALIGFANGKPDDNTYH